MRPPTPRPPLKGHSYHWPIGGGGHGSLQAPEQGPDISVLSFLGPEAHCGQARPGLGHLGDILTDTKVNGTHTPLPSRTRAFPSGREGLRADGPTLQGSAPGLNLQADPPSPAPTGPEHPALGPARLRVQVHNSAIQPPAPSQATRKALEQMQMPQTSCSQWGADKPF